MTAWLSREDTLLIELHASNMTFGEIALHFPGRTRCSVIGRAQRLGCPLRPNPSVKHSAPPKKPRPAPREPVPAATAPSGPLNTFPDKGCKHIKGDPREPGWQCCGAEQRDGSPYCDAHHKIAYQPRGVSDKAKAAETERLTGLRRVFG